MIQIDSNHNYSKWEFPEPDWLDRKVRQSGGGVEGGCASRFRLTCDVLESPLRTSPAAQDLAYFGAFINDMKTEDLITEARARITWGEASSSVRCFLIANGVSETEAYARIQELELERNREIRRIGIKDVCIGAALTGGAAVLICLILMRGHTARYTVTTGRAVGVLILMGLCGIWRLIKGLFYLIRPQSEEHSLTDIS
jgi:hypothetical protein